MSTQNVELAALFARLEAPDAYERRSAFGTLASLAVLPHEAVPHVRRYLQERLTPGASYGKAGCDLPALLLALGRLQVAALPALPELLIGLTARNP